MYVTHEFEINLLSDPNDRIIPEIQAYQREGLTRKVAFALKAGDHDWTIPSNTVCLIRFVKPDGHGGVYSTLPDSSNAWLAEGNKITITLVPQMFDVAGKVDGEAVLLWGDKTLGITDFHMIVARNPKITEKQTSDYYSFQNLDEINTVLTKLLTKTQTDVSLSMANQPADAAAVGAAVSELSADIAGLNAVAVGATPYLGLDASIGGASYETVIENWSLLPNYHSWVVNVACADGNTSPQRAIAIGHRIGDYGYFLFMHYSATTFQAVRVHARVAISVTEIGA